MPHLLIREYWVRENSLWGANTNARIAWGDAFDFRPQTLVLVRSAREDELVGPAVAGDLEKAIDEAVICAWPYLMRGFPALSLALLLAMLSWPFGGARRQAWRSFFARQAVPFLGAAFSSHARGLDTFVSQTGE